MSGTAKKMYEEFPDETLGPLAEFAEFLPPIIARRSVDSVLPGVIKPKTIQHDENKRKGPRVALFINNRRCYPIRSFLEYLNRKGVSSIRINDDLE